jgi:site-specific DNA-methyltransferase (adenine-specific)/adenine-specific DNA-methyltransferase
MSDTRNAGAKAQTDMVETLNFEPIKGYPMLQWRGKRPFTSTHFYPAQLKEQHGSDVEGWLNKIYWGDNLQVMGHLLKEYRDKVQLVYIDPPFDSRADYKKKIELHGKSVENSQSAFEEKQYGDIWTSDEYLQFMFERIILIRELLADTGVICVHCDWRKSPYMRCILDEVFGNSNLINEVTWKRKGGSSNPSSQFDVSTDTILFYSKSEKHTFIPIYSKDTPEAQQYIEERFTSTDSKGRRYMKSPIVSPNYRENLVYEYKGYKPPRNGWSISIDLMKKWDAEDRLYFPENGERIYRKIFLEEYPGQPVTNLWTDIFVINPVAKERLGYPTQKPEALLERILRVTTNPGDLVFDCFMGSGTTQAVAMKLGRRFLGADINLGAIQTTTKRLIGVVSETQAKQKTEAAKPIVTATLQLDDEFEEVGEENGGNLEPIKKAEKPTIFYTNFEVYNVNNYEIFRNPVEAKDLLIEALELQKLQAGHLFDGERDGRMWKVMSVNKIATRQDLNEIITGLNLRALADRLNATPNQPAEKITLVCMGHEPDLAATLNQEVALSLNVKAGAKMPLDVQVFDILRDRGDLQFKRDSEAKISVQGQQLVIEAFYPMNLLAKLSLEKEKVENWREMVDSVMVDFNYDGAVFNPTLLDIPEKNALVAGSYLIPPDAGTIRVKITDVLSESLEVEVQG